MVLTNSVLGLNPWCANKQRTDLSSIKVVITLFIFLVQYNISYTGWVIKSETDSLINLK